VSEYYLALDVFNSAIRFSLFASGGTSGTTFGSVSFSINQWYHGALIRQSGVWKAYVNGVAVTTGSPTNPSLNTAFGLRIGAGDVATVSYAPAFYFSGYISNVRIVNGVAVYTGNFIVPTAPLPVTQSAGSNISAITAGQTSLLTYTTQAASITGGQQIYLNSISAGNQMAFGISTQGELYAWGLNTSGQLGLSNILNANSLY
jgi:hypothetical protein